MADGKPFRKGEGGRKKGVPNKFTMAVKEAIIEAFNRSGGADYLVKVAKDDPRTFCTLLGRVLPMEVTGSNGDPISMSIKWED